MKNKIETLRAGMEDRVKGGLQLDAYKTNTFELSDWNIKSVLDDIIMVQYVDATENGKEVLRNGIYVSIDVTTHVWRVGKVILAGPMCRFVSEGNHVVFPNDRGIRASSINGLSNIVFLNEHRIFGVCELKE